MIGRSLGHRAPLLWLLLPLMGGLAIGKLGSWAPLSWQLGLALVAAGLALGMAWRLPQAWAGGVSLALFCAGSASYALHRQRIESWDALPPRECELSVRLDRVFGSTDPRKAGGLATIVRADGTGTDLVGQRIYFAVALRRGQPPLVRSAVLAIRGVIAALPRRPSRGTFDEYLANAGMNFRLTRGRVLATEQPATAYYRFCANVARTFESILGAGVAEKRPELVAVLRAMLLGRQHELSEEQKQLFRESGTLHMFSISGLHIAAIAAGLQAVLALLRLPRGAQFAIGLTALWLYVDVTGAAPSAVRAFGMVALLQSSFVLRVPSNPIAALTASALAVLLLEPMQLFGASFQMSYGIVAALLLFGLPLAEAWRERWTPFRDLPEVTWSWRHRIVLASWQWSTTAVAIGLAATLVSTVSGVLFFQLFTPGALLTNLVLIPAASLVIFAGFASLLCGIVGCAVGSIFFNHAAVLTLSLIDAIVRHFLQLPGMWFEAHFVADWLGPAVLAGLIVSMLAGYAGRWERRGGGFWMPAVLLGLAMIFAIKFGPRGN